MNQINNTGNMEELKIKVITKKLDYLYRSIRWEKEDIKNIENRLLFLKWKAEHNE